MNVDKQLYFFSSLSVYANRLQNILKLNILPLQKLAR